MGLDIDKASLYSNSVEAMDRARSVLVNRNTIHIDYTKGKAEMMRYIIHVIGDIHQPLHNVNFYNETFNDGDQGGRLMMLEVK